MIRYWFAKIIGRLPFDFRGRHRLVSFLYPQGACPRIQKPARVSGSSRYLHADSNHYIGWHVLIYGCYEKNLIGVMRRLLRHMPCRTAIDIGANIGQYSLVLSELFNQVYSFEPIPEFRDALLANLYLNQVDNVEIVPMALGRADQNVQMALLIHHDQPQTASVHTGEYAFDDQFRWEFKTAQVHSLDCFVNDRTLTAVDYLKIDTDGSEEDILAGARETLTRFQPLIQIELIEDAKKWRRGLSLIDSVHFLQKHGYEIFDANGKPHRSNVFNGNYFALPKRLIEKIN